ncbi:MAG TPA: ABC transporter substrate-binding protein [Acidimicrobiia bacterium]|nr:ABC transporter substrate-binding protein [Acidimicrobiia bacterium]
MDTRRRTPQWSRLLVVVAPLAVACTSGGTTETTGEDGEVPTTTGGEGEAPATTEGGDEGGEGSGDVFVHAADDEATTVDPAQVEPGEGGETIITQVYERLIEVGPDGPDLVPGLATEVPTIDNGLISEDGLTYTFPIREGVVFHDGTELTAEDVKYSWDRAMTMDLPEGNAGLLADIVAETNVVDDLTFEVTLSEPSASFLNAVVTASVASIVSQDAVEANGGVVAGEVNEFLTANPVGTGAYELTAWNRGENFQLGVFEDYWGTPANIDVRIDIAPDTDTRILGLRAGEYDMMEIDPSLVPDLEGAEGVEIYSGEFLLEPIHIGFNTRFEEGSLPPEDTIGPDFFQDPLIRRAFNLTFDYEGFIAGALGGMGGTVPHYFPQGMLGYSEDYPVYEQDLAAAQALFEEAGVWDEGFTVSVIAEEGNLFEVAALVLRDSMAALNPAFEIRVLAQAEAQFDEAHASDPVPYAMWVKNSDPFADPDALMNAYIHPDGEWGTVHGMREMYQDPDAIAGLIDEAGTELDTDARLALYEELAPMLYDDPMWIIAGNETALNAHRDTVTGFVMNPLWPRPSVKFAFYDK